MVKLLDYRERAAELGEDPNVFGLVVLSHLAALQTRGAMERRLAEKVGLVRRLYERGLDAADVRALSRFMDWVLTLPEDLDVRFEAEVERIEEARKMPYLMALERRALQRGREEGREEGFRAMLLRQLEARFGALSATQRAAVEVLSESEAVDMGLRLLAAASLAELGL